jgi:SAM-dependent methyltransferase
MFKDYISPKSGSELTHVEDKLIDDELNEFYIINSIPRFVPKSNYAESFGFQWNIFGKTQVDNHSKLNISKERFFRSSGWTVDDLAQSTVLEVGSGSGRFTQVILATGAKVFSFDYSNAVEANFRNNGGHPNLNICQASVYEMPFKPNTFDKVCCLGVIQHTPDVELSFSKMIEVLKPGGEIVIDVYADTLKTKFYSKYWFRPFTKRIIKKRLLSIIKWYVPKWMPVSTLLLNVPVIGKFLAQIIPFVNYSKQFPDLTKEQLYEWAILDTFDMLSPEYIILKS